MMRKYQTKAMTLESEKKVEETKNNLENSISMKSNAQFDKQQMKGMQKIAEVDQE